MGAEAAGYTTNPPVVDTMFNARPRTMALIVASVILAGVSLFQVGYFLHTSQDDAFISFRYVANLVDTGRLAFNGPEFPPAEGFSNFLWVALLSPFYWLGLPLLETSKALGFVCFAVSIAMTVRLVDRLGGERSAMHLMLVLAFLGTSWYYTLWAIQGLETPLAALLIVSAIGEYLRVEPGHQHAARHAALSGCLFGLLALTRPEAPLFGVVAVSLLLARSIRQPGYLRLALVVGICAAAIFGPYFAFRLAYYQRIFPNTYYAKVTGDGLAARGLEYVVRYVRSKGVLAATAAIGIVSGALIVATFTRHAKKAPLVVASFVAAYLAFLVKVGGDFMIGFRFIVHILPVIVALVVWASVWVMNMASQVPARWRVTGLSAVVALALHSNIVNEFNARSGLAGPISGLYKNFYELRSFPEGPQFHAARWLLEHATPETVVTCSEAGIIPFVSKLAFIDDFGLNDHDVADMIHREDPIDWQAAAILDREPDIVIMTGSGQADGFTGRHPIDRAFQRQSRFRRWFKLEEIIAAKESDPANRYAIFRKQPDLRWSDGFRSELEMGSPGSDDQVGWGWYPPEGPPDARFRWTAAAADTYLAWPRDAESATLEIEAFVPSRKRYGGKTQTVTVLWDGRRLLRQSIAHEGRALLKATIDRAAVHALHTVHLALAASFVRSSTGAENRDIRVLGVVITRVALVPTPAGRTHR